MRHPRRARLGRDEDEVDRLLRVLAARYVHVGTIVEEGRAQRGEGVFLDPRERAQAAFELLRCLVAQLRKAAHVEIARERTRRRQRLAEAPVDEYEEAAGEERKGQPFDLLPVDGRAGFCLVGREVVAREGLGPRVLPLLEASRRKTEPPVSIGT